MASDDSVNQSIETHFYSAICGVARESEAQRRLSSL